MKKSNQQGFSAGIIVVAIVCIVFVGFLGWYVWSKQTTKPETQSQQTTQQPQTAEATKAPEAPVKVENKNLVIAEWGVQVPVVGYSYATVAADVDTINLFNANLTEAAKKIDCGGLEASVGSIYRTKDVTKLTTNWQGVGAAPVVSPLIKGYYYGYMSNSGVPCDGRSNMPGHKAVMDAYRVSTDEVKAAMSKVSAE